MDELALSFWKRIDNLRGEISLKQICEDTGIKYSRVRDNRSDVRFLKVEDLLAFAKYLNSSTDFLLTGEDSSLCIEAKEVERDPELRQLVRLCINDRSLVSLIAHAIRANDMKTKDKNIG